MHDHSNLRLRADAEPDHQGGAYLIVESRRAALARVCNFNLDGCAVADARRLAACWNVCTGIPTEALEADVDGFPKSLFMVDVKSAESGLRQKLIELGWTPPEGKQ